MSELKDPLGIVEEWREQESGLAWYHDYLFPLWFFGCVFGLLAAAGLLIYGLFF
jgi:hypothetical protein